MLPPPMARAEAERTGLVTSPGNRAVDRMLDACGRKHPRPPRLPRDPLGLARDIVLAVFFLLLFVAAAIIVGAVGAAFVGGAP